MTSTGLRIYTTVIALICGAAVAWSIHQASMASSWQADARSWHAVAQRTVTHDRVTTNRMRHLVIRYNTLVVRTRRSERKLLAGMRRAQTAGAQLPSVPALASAAAPTSAGAGCRAGPRPADHAHELMRTAANIETTAAWEWRATGTTWRIHHTGASTPASPRRSRRRSSATRLAGRGSGPRARSRA